MKLLEFIENSTFTRYLSEYLDAEEYRRLQADLLKNPEAGTVIQGTGGFRKVRWGDPRRGKGKSGGIRVIYYYFPEDGQLWLMTLYDKDQADDLTPAQKRQLHEAIAREKAARAAIKKIPILPRENTRK